MKMRRRCFCCVVFVLAACGGGGGSSGPNAGGSAGTGPSGFGLTARSSLAEFSFPGNATGDAGSIAIESAYPNLSFNAALLTLQIPAEDRLVVVEQGGRVLAFEDVPGVTDVKVVMDISANTLFAGEQGLLGLAFDPNFTVNRHLYVHYSAAAVAGEPRRSIISRFTWDDIQDIVDNASEKILLTNPQPYTNHNGGMAR